MNATILDSRFFSADLAASDPEVKHAPTASSIASATGSS